MNKTERALLRDQIAIFIRDMAIRLADLQRVAQDLYLHFEDIVEEEGRE